MNRLSSTDLQILVSSLNKLKSQSKADRKAGRASAPLRFAEEAAEVLISCLTGDMKNVPYEIFDLLGLIEVFVREGSLPVAVVGSAVSSWRANRVQRDQAADVTAALSSLEQFANSLTLPPNLSSVAARSVDVESDPTFNEKVP